MLTGFLLGRYGGLGFRQSSGIEALLEKPAHEVTLEQVLDEEDLLQEIKNHHARLIDYLRQEHIIQRLLQLIIEDYTEDPSKSFKYACGSEITSLMLDML